jgi:hypothetical protein
MDPAVAPGQAEDSPTPPQLHWQSVLPPIRENLPSVVWGAALPIAVYFLVRHRVDSDTQALVIAGGVSATWVVSQFVRQRKVDVVGAIVLFGFAIGIASATLLGGNTYVLKVRDAFFTAIFGVACVVTVFTHERPTFFYFTRYFSAGNDPARVEAYDRLIEFPGGRHTFRVLSLVWGMGLVAEATFRMILAGLLHTGTFLAVSPFITASTVGSLFAFTVVYTKWVGRRAVPLLIPPVAEAAPDPEPDSDARLPTGTAGVEPTSETPLR